MNQRRLESLVMQQATQSEGDTGVVRFMYKDITMYLISDTDHNRMRIVAPIADYDSLDRDEIDMMMASNFHQALDARYAVSDGILYAAYIHPLLELTDDLIQSALDQVANLTTSFGTDYSSSTLGFSLEEYEPEPGHQVH